VQVAAAALVTFSATCFLCPPAARADETIVAPYKAEYGGPGNPGVIGDIVRNLGDGGVVIVLSPAPDGNIKAYTVQRPNSKVHVWVDHKYQGPGDDPGGYPPPPPTTVYGEGEVTAIKIFRGSGCYINTTLNGVPITIYKPNC
jgi:hypothetical protein